MKNIKSIIKSLLIFNLILFGFSCQPENSARKQCAKVGKPVCSKCVGYLYNTGIDFK